MLPSVLAPLGPPEPLPFPWSQTSHGPSEPVSLGIRNEKQPFYLSYQFLSCKLQALVTDFQGETLRML